MRMCAAFIVLALLFNSYAYSESGKSEDDNRRFSELALCAAKNNAAKFIYQTMMESVTTNPDHPWFDLASSSGDLAILHDDLIVELATEMAQVSSKNGWTEDQIKLRHEVATAQFDAVFIRKMETLIAEDDLESLFIYTMNLSGEAVNCGIGFDRNTTVH